MWVCPSCGFSLLPEQKIHNGTCRNCRYEWGFYLSGKCIAITKKGLQCQSSQYLGWALCKRHLSNFLDNPNMPTIDNTESGFPLLQGGHTRGARQEWTVGDEATNVSPLPSIADIPPRTEP